ncbi:hypothetical protein NARC_100008 [Candidatus Nitrosocosmicus arcticus]|uniref:Uncharacterized protein n=1 Tax=Candidatus Nitrosocosmicus arcticus TaxID=2035267 RepID=A0A557STK9_9ARCH|nr:hypothetical protein NARC_100008 [Candidatus Nitrosocosmicus arcticus]
MVIILVNRVIKIVNLAVIKTGPPIVSTIKSISQDLSNIYFNHKIGVCMASSKYFSLKRLWK